MPTEKEKMLNGELYDAADPELVTERRRARHLTQAYDDTAEGDDELQTLILDELLGSTGERAHITPPFRCDYGYNIHVGDGFYANFGCVFLDVRRISIGENCLVGPGVHIYTATHPLAADERVAGPEYGKPVTVGEDVWIGGRAVLNPGVTVGDGSVIASGAVVVEDIPDGVVVQGNPATVISEVTTTEKSDD